ncbi:MAG: c-type cytochrome [Steroidobacteraceae bacterium]
MKAAPSIMFSGTLLLTAFLGARAAAAGNHRAADPVRGRELSGECAACHDGDGRTRFSIYPRIAGQTYAYLLLSMKEFRSKERHQAYAATLMWPSVATLSDQDLRDLAAYYSSLPW